MTTARSARRCGVAFVVLLLLPGGVSAVSPDGTFAGEGGVRIRTKSKVLLDTAFVGRADFAYHDDPSDLGFHDGHFGVHVGPDLAPSIGAVVGAWDMIAPATARLRIDEETETRLEGKVAALVGKHLESKGHTVQQVVAETRTERGRAKWKVTSTLPPFNQVKVNITLVMKATATLQGGATKKGLVQVLITTKAIELFGNDVEPSQ